MKTVFLLLKLNKLFGPPNMQTLEGNAKKKKKKEKKNQATDPSRNK